MLNFKFNRGELEGSLASPKKIRNKKKISKTFHFLLLPIKLFSPSQPFPDPSLAGFQY